MSPSSSIENQCWTDDSWIRSSDGGATSALGCRQEPVWEQTCTEPLAGSILSRIGKGDRNLLGNILGKWYTLYTVFQIKSVADLYKAK